MVAMAATTFVHLFEWNWQDIAIECETYLGPKGYAAVQVSPPNEHITAPQWWARYQPVSYELVSRGGDKGDFIDMVQRCRSAGVDIYVDAVTNHMAAGSGTGTAGNAFTAKNFPIYSSQDFHTSCPITNYNNRYEVQYCELVGLPDLHTDAAYVQDQIANYLDDLVNVGVAGFRIDAAKHIPHTDIQAIINKVVGGPLIFQEVIDPGDEAVSASEYFGNGLVTEFKYSVEIGNTFRNGNLAHLSNFGEGWGFMPSHKAVVFIDNHDNQRGHGGGGNVITFEDGTLYDLANVFMLAYPYGYPKVMSSYDFHGDTDRGPPTVSVHHDGSLNCFQDQWKCEHRWSYIAGAMSFRNATSEYFTLSDWWTNGQNQIAFGRGNKGFVAINKEQSTLTTSLPSSMSPGTYCDVLKGKLSDDGTSCSDETITVNAGGQVQLNVAPWDAVAIHHDAKIILNPNNNDWQRTLICIQAETQSGQDMFLRGGIDHGYAKSSLSLSCNASNYLCAVPMTHNNLKNRRTAPWKVGEQFLDWYGSEANQSNEAIGTPMDRTIDVWPSSWGAKRYIDTELCREDPSNQWGVHWWMLDAIMDCSQTNDGWFEVKAFVKNGQGWESDINQANAPYASNNHFAQCGRVNVFMFGSNFVEISDFLH